MKKGIALITIVSTILILAILTVSISIGGSSILIRSRKLKFANEILQVQKLVRDYEIRKSGNLDFETITYDLNTMTDLVKKDYLELEANESNVAELYIVDIEKIDAKELVRGTISTSVLDRYLYSTKTNKVYYDAGFTIGDTTYYGINQEIKEMLK